MILTLEKLLLETTSLCGRFLWISFHPSDSHDLYGNIPKTTWLNSRKPQKHATNGLLDSIWVILDICKNSSQICSPCNPYMHTSTTLFPLRSLAFLFSYPHNLYLSWSLIPICYLIFSILSRFLPQASMWYPLLPICLFSESSKPLVCFSTIPCWKTWALGDTGSLHHWPLCLHLWAHFLPFYTLAMSFIWLDSFTEIRVTYHTSHPFKVHSSLFFSPFMGCVGLTTT